MLERVMMIAGEVSGDLHGSAVVRQLKTRLPGIRIFGVGGDLMEAEGMELLHHIRKLSVMGFAEVIRHLPEVWKVERSLEKALRDRKPQVVVLIDYPGFNLRFARKVKKRKIRLLYYISPQLWAWNRGRIRHIRSLVDQMNVVFPFEVDMYRKEEVPVAFVGHPLLERLTKAGPKEEFFRKHGIESTRRLVGLFPGSRFQEIRRILPTMVSASRMLRSKYGAQAAIGLARGMDRKKLMKFLGDDPEIILIDDATYELMQHADVAVVTSGTATLETAWFGTPMVVVYRTSLLTYFLGKMLVKVPYIGLVNIVSGRRIVPELIQGAMTPENVADRVGSLFENDDGRRRMKNDLLVVREKLGTPGASSRVADNIVALVEAA